MRRIFLDDLARRPDRVRDDGLGLSAALLAAALVATAGLLALAGYMLILVHGLAPLLGSLS